MAILLKEQKHAKAYAVSTYEVENVCFSWQTKRHNVDCGVFLMHHMEFFEGDVYSNPILEKV